MSPKAPKSVNKRNNYDKQIFFGTLKLSAKKVRRHMPETRLIPWDNLPPVTTQLHSLLKEFSDIRFSIQWRDNHWRLRLGGPLLLSDIIRSGEINIYPPSKDSPSIRIVDECTSEFLSTIADAVALYLAHRLQGKEVHYVHEAT